MILLTTCRKSEHFEEVSLEIHTFLELKIYPSLGISSVNPHSNDFESTSELYPKTPPDFRSDSTKALLTSSPNSHLSIPLALNKGKEVFLVALEIKGAFDKVCHNSYVPS